ncbi:histidine phosphatase family protein [Bacillus atrophaeus]|uniref:histidine phosphatase family protein n=1 Tax=Bacillus atrophaeus TaxID=1452 RepID=UPI00227EDBB8|nr:histidine phosphatase family protein [Bacillus atrophaeus]MCY8856989.1 histidine phosphatase family protein [Bacillus atrophaeus]
MLYLYIVRHGQTEWNTEHRMQGWQDSDLTAEGLRRARALGERLKHTDFQKVYISTSKRTEDTAKAILGNRQVPLEKEDLFREMSLGTWEGKKHEDIEKEEPERLHAYFHQPTAYQPADGETFEELEQRVKRALQMLTDRHQSGNVLLVTHSVFILMLLNIVKKRGISEVWNSSYIHDTSLTLLTIDAAGTITIKKEGDGEHRESTVSL